MQNLIYQELLNIADNRDIEVIDYSFKSITMKGLYIQDGDIKVIFLNEGLDDPVERNFVLAHELGHDAIHQGKINENLYFNSKDTHYRDRLEDEANNYADTLINKIIGGLKGGV